MFLIGQIVILFLCLYMFAILWIVKKISLRRDYLFFIIMALSFIYLFIYPISNQLIDKDLDTKTYFMISLFIILFFYIPLFFFYTRNNKVDIDAKCVLAPKKHKEFGYSMFCLLFAIGFYIVAIPNSLFYVRESTFNPELKSNLNFIQFLVYRSYIEYASIIILLSTFLFIRFGVNYYSLFFRVAYITFTLSYLLFLLINSRLGLLLFFLQLVGLFLLFARRIRISKRNVVLIVFASLFAIYGYKVILNVRSNIDTYGFQLAYLNPMGFKIDTDVSESLNTRLDGVYLMVEMTPAALKKGFALGKAWLVPLFLTIAPVLFPAQAQALKASYMTDSESYLLLNYTNLANATMDFNSVFLTDLYCNFSYWGFILAALFISSVAKYAKKKIIMPTSKLNLVLAVFFFSKLMIFESESIALLLKLLKFIPMLLVILWFFPVSKNNVKGTYDNNNSNTNL